MGAIAANSKTGCRSSVGLRTNEPVPARGPNDPRQQRLFGALAAMRRSLLSVAQPAVLAVSELKNTARLETLVDRPRQGRLLPLRG